MAGMPQQPIKADLSCQRKTDAASLERLAGSASSQGRATIFKGNDTPDCAGALWRLGAGTDLCATLTTPGKADRTREMETFGHLHLFTGTLRGV